MYAYLQQCFEEGLLGVAPTAGMTGNVSTNGARLQNEIHKNCAGHGLAMHLPAVAACDGVHVFSAYAYAHAGVPVACTSMLCAKVRHMVIQQKEQISFLLVPRVLVYDESSRCSGIDC